MYKGQIRDSTIRGLLEKAAQQNYRRYLAKMVLKKVRGFNDEPVAFDFPVTAIIGPNGGGKTTILGAAGCAYKSVAPKRFFAKSGKYDESMQEWAIEYDIIDRDVNRKDLIRRTARFRNQRWNRDPPDRPVLVFGVTRTVPANERSELLRCASSTFQVPAEQVEDLSETVRSAVSRILGKDITGFKRMRVDNDGRVVLLTGRTSGGHTYSEFHFGAGESSIIRMVSQIELAEEQTLVLIEEIENGLHPVATVRLIEYLIDAADRKKIQAIFTTHSNDALKPLPTKAIWVATQDRIFQGKLDIQSLRAITGQIEASLVVFVEDVFAKTWFEAMVRQFGGVALDHLQVHAMQGDGMAVAINSHHNKDPSTKVPSACFIDGDSRQAESQDTRTFRLPGQAPEAHVFDEVMQTWDKFGAKLTVALLQRYEDTERVRNVCIDVQRTNVDSHLLFAQVGEQLGLIPESTVAAAFANVWAQAYPEVVANTLAPIKQLLPMETERAAAQ